MLEMDHQPADQDTPEQRLWMTVIEQAVLDAIAWRELQAGMRTGSNLSPAALLGLRTAENWFCSPGFDEVCELASVNAAYMRREIRRRVSQNVKKSA